jgi:hypothetical protein
VHGTAQDPLLPYRQLPPTYVSTRFSAVPTWALFERSRFPATISDSDVIDALLSMQRFPAT